SARPLSLSRRSSHLWRSSPGCWKRSSHAPPSAADARLNVKAGLAAREGKRPEFRQMRSRHRRLAPIGVSGRSESPALPRKEEGAALLQGPAGGTELTVNPL